MNWPLIESVLNQLALMSGVDRTAIQWEDTPSKAAFSGSKGQTLIMAINVESADGYDEVRRTQSGNDADDQVVAVVGQRNFTWSVKCESQDATAGKFALMWLDNLRAGLSRDSIQPLLQSGNISIRDILATKKVSYPDKKTKRQISAYVMDVICGGVEDAPDTTPGAGNWIKSTNTIDSEYVTNPDGSRGQQRSISVSADKEPP